MYITLSFYNLITFILPPSIINMKPCCVFEAFCLSFFPSLAAIDKASKAAQDGVEKATGQAAEAMSGFGKKCGFKK